MTTDNDYSLIKLFESCNQSAQEVDEGIGKAALLGLAALTSAATSSFGGTNDKAKAPAKTGIVQKASAPAKSLGGYTYAQATNIVARTIYAEAKGDGTNGLEMVATVIWNRANGNADRMPGVCKANRQFSCWNAMTEADWNAATFKVKEYDDTLWTKSKDIAREMLAGTFTKKGEYVSYYANKGKYAAAKTPSWAKGRIGHQSGNHVFYTKAELERKLPAANATATASAKPAAVKKPTTVAFKTKLGGKSKVKPVGKAKAGSPKGRKKAVGRVARSGIASSGTPPRKAKKR